MWSKFLHREPALLTFVGGPLDGYQEENKTPLAQMPEVLGILISPDIVKMLTNPHLVAETVPTSLAFYEQESTKSLRYAFVGSTGPEAVELDDH